MAHRKTQAEAQEVKASFEKNHPGLEIAITPHQRGGFMIREVRECEKCGCQIFTAAVGEIETGGNYCYKCKTEVYEQQWKKSNIESAARNAKDQAYYDAEAWYYAEEG